MLSNACFKEIYIACGHTDLRFGIDGLAASVREKFNLSPFEKDVIFLFCGRRNDRIKALVWEGDGFLLLYKRVENGRFKWPRSSEELMNLNARQFECLLSGFAIEPGIKMVSPPEKVI